MVLADHVRAWYDLTSLVRVACERRIGDRITTDVRIFLSSLPPKARLPLQGVHSHRAIENAHHRVLDVAFGEDDSRIRTGYPAHNRAIPGASPTTSCGRTAP